jgi:hypothetical protein
MNLLRFYYINYQTGTDTERIYGTPVAPRKTIPNPISADSYVEVAGDFVSQVLEAHEENLNHKEKMKLDGWNLNKITQRACDILDLDVSIIQTNSCIQKISDARGMISY